MAGAFEDGTALAFRYYAFRSGAWLAERLPLRLTDAVANLGGRIAFRLAKPPRRQMVARNMARVAGAHGPGAGDALVKGTLPNFGPIFEAYANDLKREAERIAIERAG